MKYIKTYNENISSLKDYKKYIIIKAKHKNLPYDLPLLLMEVISINENKNSIYYIQHYEYKNNRINKVSTIYTRKEIMYNMTDKWEVLYTSDNINECLDMLPILNNTNKYNL